MGHAKGHIKGHMEMYSFGWENERRDTLQSRGPRRHVQMKSANAPNETGLNTFTLAIPAT